MGAVGGWAHGHLPCVDHLQAHIPELPAPTGHRRAGRAGGQSTHHRAISEDRWQNCVTSSAVPVQNFYSNLLMLLKIIINAFFRTMVKNK